MSTFYPSGLLQLLVRLDTGFGPLPPEAIAALQGQQGSLSTPATSLEAFAPADDGFSILNAILPAEVSHERNGPRQADTLTVRIPFKDFPLPARAVRSIGVVWYAGTVSADNYARGMSRALAGDSGSNSAILIPSRKNLRFVGFADGVTEDHAAHSIVFQARDYTGILLDTRVKPEVLQKLDIGMTLDLVVLQLLREFPGNGARGLEVEFQQWVDETGQPQPFPVVAEVYGPAAQARKGKKPRLPASRGGADISYWDLLTDLCVMCGFIPVIEEDRLRIIPPRNFYASAGSFSRVVGGETLTTRRMVHGANIKGLSFTRKFGRLAVPSIEVISSAPGLRVPLRSKYPADVPGKGANTVLPSGRGAAERSELVLIKGISSQTELDRFAAGLWEEYGRQEWQGKLSTQDLASLGDPRIPTGGNAEPDLLDVRSGDPFQVVIQRRSQDTGVLSTLSDLDTPSARLAAMKRWGVSASAAEALVRLYDATRQMGDTFRVRQVSATWQLGGDSPKVSLGFSLGTFLNAPALPSPNIPIEVSEPVRVKV